MFPKDSFLKYEFVIVIGDRADPEPMLLSRTVWSNSLTDAYWHLRDLFRDENVLAIIEGAGDE